MKVVTPDWLIDSINVGSLVAEEEYRPMGRGRGGHTHPEPQEAVQCNGDLHDNNKQTAMDHFTDHSQTTSDHSVTEVDQKSMEVGPLPVLPAATEEAVTGDTAAVSERESGVDGGAGEMEVGSEVGSQTRGDIEGAPVVSGETHGAGAGDVETVSGEEEGERGDVGRGCWQA